MKLPGVAWRALTGYDCRRSNRSPPTVHPDFFESLEVLAERQRLYLNGAYLLEVNERPAGYVLSHPWRLRRSAAAQHAARRAARERRHLLHPRSRAAAGGPPHRRRELHHRGAAKHARAHGFPTMSLVAVNGSQGFWERHGFAVEDRPDLTQKLASYEDSAAR